MFCLELRPLSGRFSVCMYSTCFGAFSGEFVVALPQPPPLLSNALLIEVSSSATSCFLLSQEKDAN